MKDDSKDMAEHIRLHEQHICDQRVVNLRLMDHVKALEEELKRMKEADDTRKKADGPLVKKLLPEGRGEGHERRYKVEAISLTSLFKAEGGSKAYDPFCPELWKKEDAKSLQRASRGLSLIENLTKRPPLKHL